MARSIYGRPLFKTEDDYELFALQVKSTKAKPGCQVLEMNILDSRNHDSGKLETDIPGVGNLLNSA